MTSSSRPTGRAAFASACAVVILSAIVAALHDLGPHARHMGLHVLAMNVVAPLLAAVLATRMRHRWRAGWLWTAALAQIALLWAAHVPAVQNAAMHGAPQVALHAVLLMAGLAFWVALLSLPDAKRWHAIPALLLTGKLVCLLAALLVFAPRALYGVGHHDHTLDDQQLAALLMLAACPLSYLVAGVILAVELIPRTALPAARAVGWR